MLGRPHPSFAPAVHPAQQRFHAVARPQKTDGLHVNRLALRVQVVIKLEIDDVMHDSKKETGFVGLRDLSASCYMNSLLQTLYNINYFRQVGTLSHLPSEGQQFIKSPCLPIDACTKACSVYEDPMLGCRQYTTCLPQRRSSQIKASRWPCKRSSTRLVGA